LEPVSPKKVMMPKTERDFLKAKKIIRMR